MLAHIPFLYMIDQEFDVASKWGFEFNLILSNNTTFRLHIADLPCTNYIPYEALKQHPYANACRASHAVTYLVERPMLLGDVHSLVPDISRKSLPYHAPSPNVLQATKPACLHHLGRKNGPGSVKAMSLGILPRSLPSSAINKPPPDHRLIVEEQMVEALPLMCHDSSSHMRANLGMVRHSYVSCHARHGPQ